MMRLRRATVACVGSVGLLAVGSVPAAISGELAAGVKGKVAFERNGSIYLVNPDGSGLRRLRMHASVKPKCLGEGQMCTTTIRWHDPALSPDGKRLALLGSFENGLLGGDTRVYVREPGGRTRQVYKSDTGSGSVAWSPDGAWLTHDAGCSYTDPLLLIRVRTGGSHAIADNGRNGSWSPDGKRIAFRYARGLTSDATRIWRGIATVRRDGRELKRLTQIGDNPDWSPNETRIAFAMTPAAPYCSSDAKGLGTVDRAGHVRVLTRSGGHPSWSPDGKRIAFERRGNIWLMDANGGRQHLLVKNGRSPDWSR